MFGFRTQQLDFQEIIPEEYNFSIFATSAITGRSYQTKGSLSICRVTQNDQVEYGKLANSSKYLGYHIPTGTEFQMTGVFAAVDDLILTTTRLLRMTSDGIEEIFLGDIKGLLPDKHILVLENQFLRKYSLKTLCCVESWPIDVFKPIRTGVGLEYEILPIDRSSQMEAIESADLKKFRRFYPFIVEATNLYQAFQVGRCYTMSVNSEQEFREFCKFCISIDADVLWTPVFRVPRQRFFGRAAIVDLSVQRMFLDIDEEYSSVLEKLPSVLHQIPELTLLETFPSTSGNFHGVFQLASEMNSLEYLKLITKVQLLAYEFNLEIDPVCRNLMHTYFPELPIVPTGKFQRQL